MSDINKYNSMEGTLHEVNRNFIDLPLDEIRRNNIVLHEIIWTIVNEMRKVPLFSKLFRTIFYGGSYYDGLKVGHPDEYDLDLLLAFPKSYQAKVARSTKPGYVHATLGDKQEYGFLCEPTNNNYLDTQKILSWMQGLLDTALFRLNGTWTGLKGVHISRRKAGPAFTLCLRGVLDDVPIKMDIDLVTCISFNADAWPEGGYRKPFGIYEGGSFFIVPKSKTDTHHSSRYWRLSFQEQERNLINGKEKLKPALRLLKKMRNTQNQPISSYHLKTIVLWEIFEHPENISSDKSLSFVFMHILKLYTEKIKQKKIQYFWNTKLNLIEDMHSEACFNIGRFLENIIKAIDKNPCLIVKYLLEPHEMKQLPREQTFVETEDSGSSCNIL
ncbi:hypothetical protein JTB14_005820 [Gonioctena quinquepunctata]|nr:hypothetical protein JTB14_005820 [Gonioctena quinquepunctata]